jgi:casein kinase II subunit beta
MSEGFSDDSNSSSIEENEVENNSGESCWTQWFCSLEGHDYLAEVTEDFLKDKSNFFGLSSKVSNFSDALYQILNGAVPDDEDLQNDQYLELYQNCVDLYGLIHARFIQTPIGLTIMREKFLSGKFGVCPRVLCDKNNVIPVGMSNEIRTSRVKVFCPRCSDVYYPKDRNIELDGAYFGSSFPHVLMQNFPFLYPIQENKEYCPKIYGFKVHNGRGAFSLKIDTKYRVY